MNSLLSAQANAFSYEESVTTHEDACERQDGRHKPYGGPKRFCKQAESAEM
jgi:hypothetical protein